RGDETLSRSQRIARGDVVHQYRDAFIDYSLNHGAADFDRPRIIWPIPSMDSCEFFLILSQQDRAALRRHHFKDRVDDLAHQLLSVTQPIDARRHLEQYAKVSLCSFMLRR